MSKPIPSTRGVYKPGVGRTITHANIADEQARRVKEHRDPADAEDIVREFVMRPGARGLPLPKRHLARAMRLMVKEQE